MEFGSAPPSGVDAMMQRPQMIPIPSRRREEEELSPLDLRNPNRKFEQAMKDMDRRTGRDPLDLRDPSKMRDPSRRGWDNDPSSSDPLNPKRKDEPRSLSPITEFGWEARDAGRRSTESGRSGNNAKDREKTPRERSPFDVPENPGSDASRPSSPFEMFASRTREKPTAQQLERRAGFDKLMNPNAELVAKGSGSLDPVDAAAAPPPAGSPIPMLGRGLTPLPPLSDPTAAFNRQQERWKAPSFDSAYQKYAAPAALAPAPVAKPLQVPLNRQPTTHEFPGRRF